MKTILRVALPLLAVLLFWPVAATAQWGLPSLPKPPRQLAPPPQGQEEPRRADEARPADPKPADAQPAPQAKKANDPDKGMKKYRLESAVTSTWRKTRNLEEEAKGPGQPYLENDAVIKMRDDEVAQCKAAVDRALAEGLDPADTVQVEDDGIFTPMAVGDVKAKVCDAFREGCVKVAALNKVAYERQFKPWKDVLKGDRWTVWYDHGFFTINPRGVGGTVLDTPQALAKSNTWCETLGDENDPWHPTWKVRCWHFKGDKQSGPPVEKVGNGRDPPTHVYK